MSRKKNVELRLSLLVALQQNACESDQLLARRLKSSPSRISRIRRELTDSGHIKKVVAILDANKVGMQALAFYWLTLVDPNKVQETGAELAKHPEVLEIYVVDVNTCNLRIKVHTPTTGELSEFGRRVLTTKNNISRKDMEIVWATYKETTELNADGFHIR